jgi:hypothetical protein
MLGLFVGVKEAGSPFLAGLFEGLIVTVEEVWERRLLDVN